LMVVATPLICGKYASVTIAILLQFM